MAGKSSKKSDAGSVMGNLPATRPSRLSRRAREDDGGAAAASKAKAASPKPKAASPKPKAAKSKPAKPGPARPQVKVVAKPSRPTPVRPATPKLDGTARKADAKRGETPAADRGQSGAELATTVVKAAGELAQIGATVAGQVIKRAVDRLPKP